MNSLPVDPVRLREKHDQQNLAERIAGEAARALAELPRFSPSTMARIATQIETRRIGSYRPRRRRWTLAAAAFLLGIATAASAARLDLVPEWITRMVHRSASSSTPVSGNVKATTVRSEGATGRSNSAQHARASCGSECRVCESVDTVEPNC